MLLHEFRTEAKRLRWELLATVLTIAVVMIAGISRANVEAVVFKFLVFCPAVILVHLSRSALFPYIDLKSVMTGADGWKNQPVNLRAAVILSVFAYYVGLIYALTQSL